MKHPTCPACGETLRMRGGEGYEHKCRSPNAPAVRARDAIEPMLGKLDEAASALLIVVGRDELVHVAAHGAKQPLVHEMINVMARLLGVNGQRLFWEIEQAVERLAKVKT